MLLPLLSLLLGCSTSEPQDTPTALAYAQWYTSTTTYAMDPGVSVPRIDTSRVRPYESLQPPDFVMIVAADGTRTAPGAPLGSGQTWAIAADANAPAAAVIDAAGRLPNAGPDVASTPGAHQYRVVVAAIEPRQPRPDAPYDGLSERIDAIEAEWANADVSTILASWQASTETCAPMAAVVEAIESGAGCEMTAATVSEAVIDPSCDNSKEGLALLSVMCDRGPGTHPTYYPKLVIPDAIAPIAEGLMWGEAVSQWHAMDGSTLVVRVPSP